MIIGAYGTFWDRELVDWHTRAWKLLGRRGRNAGTIQVADFRRARGVYILYNDINVYYVGLASSKNGLGGRLHDHLKDEHGSRWTRFSWFSFDSPDDETPTDAEGVLKVNDHYSGIEQLDTSVLIRDLEALLQTAMQPLANKSITNFSEGDEWLQVATQTPEVQTFDYFKNRIAPEG